MRVFISHAVSDSDLATRIADGLKQAGFEVWDYNEILPGENWGEKVGQALEESDAMVVLLTPNSVHSPNINYEVGYALGRLEYKGRLIPVIAAPQGELSSGEIPWILNRFQTIRLDEPARDSQGIRKIAEVLKRAA